MRFNFETKIFWMIFGATAFVGSGLAVAAYLQSTRMIRQAFLDRYSSLNRMLGESIVQSEASAEVAMLNAALVIKGRDTGKNAMSTDELKNLARSLSLTHIFMVNSEGKFIRSTNESPDLIPNLFSFCSDYRNMFLGKLDIQATPIIPPNPEPKPYKFLTIPNASKSRLIHVGLRVDFIADLMKKVLSEDSNVNSIAVFAPNGTSLGLFGPHEGDLRRVTDSTVVDASEGSKEEKDGIKVSNWIPSAHPVCCQCSKLGITRNGRYDYLIRSTISKRPIELAVAEALKFCYFAVLGAFVAAFILARFLSAKMVSRLKHLTAQTKKIDSGSEILQVNGFDEVFELGRAFNALLERLREAQIRLIESEKKETIANLATQVAHDIRSPLSALQIAVVTTKDMPEKQGRLIREAVQRINGIADDLLKQAKETHILAANIWEVIDSVVEEKRLEFSQKFPHLLFEVSGLDVENCLVRMNLPDFQRCISNLFNNAAESSPAQGKIRVRVTKPAEKIVRIEIEDEGRGIPEEVLRQLGKAKVTHGKSSGNGTGFLFCQKSMESLSGRIAIFSSVGKGTRVVIDLPVC